MLSWARGMRIVFPKMVIALFCMRAVEHRVHWTFALSALEMELLAQLVCLTNVRIVMARANASNANRSTAHRQRSNMLAQLEHMKKWALQDQSALSKEQLCQSFAAMCDDAIREITAAEQGVQSDGARCSCATPQISTLVNPGICYLCKLPRQ